MSTALSQLSPPATELAPVPAFSGLPTPYDVSAHGVGLMPSSPPASPATDDYARAWWDWYFTMCRHPDQQLSLANELVARTADTWRFAWRAAANQLLALNTPFTPRVPLAHEHGEARFLDAAWNQWPFNALVRGYANLGQLSERALASAEGMQPDNAQRLEFLQRQLLDAISPANFLATNPEVQKLTRTESGANLLRGFQYWLEDAQRLLTGGAPAGTENYRVGEQVAVTPGKVVMRNALVELIQYSPAADSEHGPNVYAEPILITPAWIMKYYVLDLSPHNSLVRFLVERGHTVFMISWRNPTGVDRNLGMDDYVELGLRAALDAVTAIVPHKCVHAVGYCIGGTLLSIGAAALAGAGDTRIGSITLLAAQTDFSEPGELSVFISPNQLAKLDMLMQRTGVLGSERMGAAFAMLRASDLIWAPAVNQYLRGQRGSVNDLMAWNADGTRMPCRMHSEYLRRLYLDNELANGHFTVAGKNVSLSLIHI